MATGRSPCANFWREAAGVFRLVQPPDLTQSDSTHPVLFVEAKLRASLPSGRRQTTSKSGPRRRARSRSLRFSNKNRPGFLLVIHCDDLAVVLAEYIVGLDPEERGRLEGMIRQAQDRSRARPEGSLTPKEGSEFRVLAFRDRCEADIISFHLTSP